MTNKDAVKWLENLRQDIGQLRHEDLWHYEQAIAEIMEVLKEQEAIKPVLEQDSMVCGICGHEVIWQKMIGDGIWADEQLNFCPNCGKAVKWE